MIFEIEVGVALHRPPGIHRVSKVLIDSPNAQADLSDLWDLETRAKFAALEMAMGRRDVVMPIYAQVLSVDRL